MHPATSQAIYGMIQVVRQSLIGIEAILSAEDTSTRKETAQVREESQADGTESKWLDDRQEEMLGKLFGLSENGSK